MSTVKSNNHQIGQSLTAAQNFTLYQPTTPDGTVRLGVGNSGSTTADLVTFSSGVVSVTGEVRATTTVTAYYSDERLKENIVDIPNALEKVTQLRGVTYEPNAIAESFGFKKEPQVGVLAGDVQKVLPEAIKPAPFDVMLFEGKEMSRSGENYRTVQYEKLVPLLVQAIKELKEEVDRLKGE